MINGLVAGLGIALLGLVFLSVILWATKEDVRQLEAQAKAQTKDGDSKKSDSVLTPVQDVSYEEIAQLTKGNWILLDAHDARDERIDELKKLADLQQKEIELMFGLISRKRLFCEWTQSEFASLQEEIKHIHDQKN